MRTSREVYFQLRYDPRFDPRHYVVGYEARREDAAEKPLVEFVPDGEIPWHRVLYLRDASHRVWDRATRLDALVPPAVAKSLPHVPAGSVRALEALPGPPLPAGTPLRVITWNVLSDRFDSLGLRSRERVPLILTALRSFDADIVVLQEVFAPVWAAIRADSVLSQRYTLPAEAPGVPGVVILSRFGVRARWVVDFSPHKRLVVADIGPWRVVGCHFTSDHSLTATEARAKEWAAALALVGAHTGPALIAGDLNDEAPALVDFVSHSTAPTFEPSHNALAALGSTSARDRQLDHVLARGAAIACERVTFSGELLPSDHWAVSATVTPEASGAFDPKTALVLLLPEAAWHYVQPCRLAHDRHATRWPPHITLKHPFAAPEQLSAVLAQITATARQLQPFAIRFEQLSHFSHCHTTTHWAVPQCDPPNALAQLQGAIDAAWGEGRGALTPHLTLGQTGPGHAPPAAHQALAALRGYHWPVVSLAVLRRSGDEAFETLVEIPLGAVGTTQPLVDRRATFTSAMTVQTALHKVWPGVELERVGSARLGLDDPLADVDLVARLPVGVTSEQLLSALPTAQLTDGRIEMTVGDTDVDVLPFDAQDPTSLVPGLDADAVLARVPTQRHGHFRDALWGLRSWLEQRGLVGQWAGYPSGLAWAALVAELIREGANTLPEVFQGLAAWPHDVVLTSEGRRPVVGSRWLTVHTAHGQDATRGLVDATRRVLRHELSRALTARPTPAEPTPEWPVTVSHFESKAGAVAQLITWQRNGVWARPVTHRRRASLVWLSPWNHAPSRNPL
jgi:poly(A) polymerase